MKKPWPWEVDEKGIKKYREIVLNTALGIFIVGSFNLWLPIYFNIIEYVKDLENTHLHMKS